MSNSVLTSCFLHTDVESVWNIIKSVVLSSMHQYIPKYRIKNRKSPRWFTSEIRHLLNCLRSLRKKYKTHPTQNNLNHLKSAESHLQQKISNAKTDYEQTLVNSCSNNMSKLFQHVNSITCSKSIPLTMNYDSTSACSNFDKACLFNNFFFSVFNNESSTINLDSIPLLSRTLSSINFSENDVYNALTSLQSNKATGIDDIGPNILKVCAPVLYKPLHYLFTLSIHHCKLPSEWLIHCITPVFKSGNKNSVKNYRPISLLCNTSKVLEKIIYDKIIEFVSKSISSSQFGALKGRSAIQQLLVFLHQIVNSTMQTDVIYLDIQKAFDSIPHCKLLAKLWSFGITGNLWRWILCYLSGRTQVVRINNVLSTTLPVLSGVPQGSILGPVLFLIYMNDLPSVTTVSKSLLFVDDTKCFNNVSNTMDLVSLQQDLDFIARWSIQSSLKFNTTKSVHLSFKSKVTTTFKLLDVPVVTNTTHKDLGIILSVDLSWDYHYEHITSKAYRMLGLLRHTFSKSLSISAKKLLYISLVRSQLIYGSPIWRLFLIKDIKLIEQIQCKATKFILNDFHSDYYNCLVKLQFLPIMYMFELYDVMFLVKSLKNHSPCFRITDYISFSHSSTRSSSTNKLQHIHSRNNYIKNFYFNRLPRIWNSLPPIDLSLPTIIIKTRLYKFF